MTEQVALRLHNRNPDVLTCIANLSNDEVFTPPELANQMLDLVAAAWADETRRREHLDRPSVRFLDPFTKSGVFLREITSRLTDGLKDEIPDLEARVDHILTNQVFGIAITRLTSLIARRSLYCSKWANGKHSIARSFSTDNGNIWFEPLEHTWVRSHRVRRDRRGQRHARFSRGTNGRCSYCGATQRDYDRGEQLETHAYALIHTDDIKARMVELFGDKMQFDVIDRESALPVGAERRRGRRQFRDADLPEVRASGQVAWIRGTSSWSPRHAGSPAVEDSTTSARRCWLIGACGSLVDFPGLPRGLRRGGHRRRDLLLPVGLVLGWRMRGLHGRRRRRRPADESTASTSTTSSSATTRRSRS